MEKMADALEIIIPIYNEESCLEALMKRLLKLKENCRDLDLSFLFVNDGSKDRSLEMLYAFAAKFPFIKIINFSRNFGHQIAVSAGLDHADADFIAIIDADLQDPPELIETMYRKAKEGYDVIYGQRLTRKGESLFKKLSAKMFYRFISFMCDIEIPLDTGDFRLITRRVLENIKSMPEKHRFLRGMFPWIGFKSSPVFYNRDERFAGETKYPLKKMMRFAKDAIFSFSNTPLRFVTMVGLFIVAIGAVCGLGLLYLRLFTTYTVPGITAVILAIIIIGGIQIIMLGVMGEYVGRIFEESKKRPLYIIESLKNIPLKNEIGE